MDTLHFCLQVDTKQALEAKAMEVFTELLKHINESIKCKAARDIFDLSIPLQGKNEALTLPTVKLLVRLLLDKDTNVKCKAALALESIAITTPGKYSCIKEGAINNLVHLIDEPLSETKVNALKVKSLKV